MATYKICFDCGERDPKTFGEGACPACGSERFYLESDEPWKVIDGEEDLGEEDGRNFN